MAVTINGTSGVTFNDGSTQASAGQILQVLHTTATNQVSSSGGYVAMGLSLAITPKTTSSKILIMFSGRGAIEASARVVYIGIYRGGSLLQEFRTFSCPAEATGISFTASCLYRDSPATTSSTTYAMYFKANDGPGPYYMNPDGASDGPRCLTLMEIAG